MLLRRVQAFIVKRTVSMFVTLFLVSVTIFVMVRLLPGVLGNENDRAPGHASVAREPFDRRRLL